MRRRRMLLATTALSTMTFLGCRKDAPLPANPKGSAYDDAAPLPLPANPKGAMYDAGLTPSDPAPPTSAVASASAAPTNAAASASATPSTKSTGPTLPTVRPLPANPKGSHYDAGLKPKP